MASAGMTGDIGKPDVAIFADTGAEPETVLRWLDWLEPKLTFPVIRVNAGSLREDIKAVAAGEPGRRFAGVPFFLIGQDGKKGMAMRQCTERHKVRPISRELRRLLGAGPRGRIKAASVECWIGISTDEAQRMKPARQQWQTNRWPLIEMGMSRRDCVEWMERHGYPKAPKSACTFCPFRNNAGWRWMRQSDPDAFEDACRIDEVIRSTPKLGGFRGTPFVHASRTPLRTADIGEGGRDPDLFGMECEGMCGV
jgi:hypothetical protein